MHLKHKPVGQRSPRGWCKCDVCLGDTSIPPVHSLAHIWTCVLEQPAAIIINASWSAGISGFASKTNSIKPIECLDRMYC